MVRGWFTCRSSGIKYPSVSKKARMVSTDPSESGFSQRGACVSGGHLPYCASWDEDILKVEHPILVHHCWKKLRRFLQASSESPLEGPGSPLGWLLHHVKDGLPERMREASNQKHGSRFFLRFNCWAFVFSLFVTLPAQLFSLCVISQMDRMSFSAQAGGEHGGCLQPLPRLLRARSLQGR